MPLAICFCCNIGSAVVTLYYELLLAAEGAVELVWIEAVTARLLARTNWMLLHRLRQRQLWLVRLNARLECWSKRHTGTTLEQ